MLAVLTVVVIWMIEKGWFWCLLLLHMASGDSSVKDLPAMQEPQKTWV